MHELHKQHELSLTDEAGMFLNLPVLRMLPPNKLNSMTGTEVFKVFIFVWWETFYVFSQKTMSLIIRQLRNT